MFEPDKDALRIAELDKMLRQRMSRSAPIEEWLMQAGMGKRPLPTADECREWSIKLGVPDEMREFAPADKDAEIARLTAALRDICGIASRKAHSAHPESGAHNAALGWIDHGPAPGPHGAWSRVMECICDCPARRPKNEENGA